MAARKRNPTEAAPKRGEGPKRIYEEIKNDILTLKLAPGELLDEASIAARFKLSRSPVREALVRLASDGLIQTLPNKNTIVRALNFDRIPQYLDAIELMLRVSARWAAQFRTEEDLRRIVEAQESLMGPGAWDAVRMIESNRRYHMAISEAGKNPYFTQFYTRLFDEGRQLLYMLFSSLDERMPKAFVDSHRKLVQAIKDKDAALADEIAHEHAQAVREQFLTYIRTSGTAGFSLDLGDRRN